MNWHTAVPLSAFPESIHHGDSILALGSCFAAAIGNQMEEHMFDVCTNPAGIHFNLDSLSAILLRALNFSPILAEELQTKDDLSFHWLFQKQFADPNSTKAIVRMNEALEILRQRLKEADWILLTAGTSIVHRVKENGVIVANCHKVPQKQFTREMLTIKYQVDRVSQLIDSVSEFNVNTKYLFTVSPIRHLRHGFVDNSRSKSRLIEVVHQLCEKYPDRCFYFPSYEIVMDSLRDYRWYREDMIHLSEVAENYIWRKLQEALFTSDTKEYVDHLSKYLQMKQHKPTHPSSEEGRAFEQKKLDYLNSLIQTYPHLQKRL